MASPYILVPRTEIGLDPVVRSSGGSPRPPVITPALYVTHHYTGVNVRYGDIGDTAAEIRAIEDYAQRVGKPNEYNYVNHQDPDNKIFEYAGGFRAAHSSGENSISFGVLHLIGTQEKLNLIMVDKMKWLNDVFRYFGMINFATQQRGHQQMPGAATACPGTDVMWWLPEFGKSHTPPPPQPLPPPKPTPKPPVPVDPPDAPDNVGYYLVTDRKSPWSISSEIYGTGTRWPEIMEANAPDETPNPGERWVVPGFKGKWVAVQSGEGPWQLLNRVFGSDGWNKSEGVNQFWQWNGGDPLYGGRMFNGKQIALQPGERVWVRI
jgi:hypothetical protein